MDQSPGKVEYFCGKLYSCNQTKGSKTKKRKLKKKEKKSGYQCKIGKFTYLFTKQKYICIYLCR